MPESHFDPRMPGHQGLELQEVCPVTRAIHGGSRLLAKLQPVIGSIRVEFEDTADAIAVTPNERHDSLSNSSYVI